MSAFAVHSLNPAAGMVSGLGGAELGVGKLLVLCGGCKRSMEFQCGSFQYFINTLPSRDMEILFPGLKPGCLHNQQREAVLFRGLTSVKSQSSLYKW